MATELTGEQARQVLGVPTPRGLALLEAWLAFNGGEA